MKSKITTKRGDTGQTSALSGERISKAHPIIECTGCLDELRTHVALVRQLLLERASPDDGATAEFLLWLLHVCFVIGSQVSDPQNKKPQYRVANLGPEHLERLEREEANLDERVDLPKAFIVSATNPLAAHVDLTCTVARRFERSLVALKEAVPEFDTSVVVPFVNRLSDYLFFLARYVEGGHHHTVDYGILRNKD